MIDFDETEKEIKKCLSLRYDNPTTVDLYALRLMGLVKYYPATRPLDISESEINKYIRVLVTKKSSFSLVNQLLQAVEYYYNHIHKKSYIFDRQNLPKRNEIKVQLLNQEDVFLMIDNFTNEKHRAIFVLVYTCCLELEELIRIRQTDLNTRNFPYHIKIRNKNDEIVRQSFISDRVKRYLSDYWKDCKQKPETYLFEGVTRGKMYTTSSSHKVLKKAFEDIGVSSEYETKVLRRSYMKHMVDLGVPIISVLDNLGIRHFDSIQKYTKIIHGDTSIKFTPLDKVIGKPKINEPEIEELERLIFDLKTKDEQDYLLEALQCFRAGALKAGIVFSWSACIRYLQNRCVDEGYPKINEALKKMQSPKKIKKLSDFETIKETSLLSIALELKVISKHQKSQLDNNLDLRNHCGHPSEYKVEINKTKAFIEDIVNLIKNEPQSSRWLTGL